MKIVIRHGKNRDGYDFDELSINGKDRCSVYPLCDCPEDAIIGRNLISCDEISGYMKEAFDAGARGETWEIETVPMGDDE